MITAVRDLGEWIQSYEQKEPLDVLIEPINRENYPYAVLLSIQGDEWDIELEECDPRTSTKYLYRRKGSTGANYSPTAMVTEIKQTFEMRFEAWFKKFTKKLKKKTEDNAIVFHIANIIEKDKDAIINAMLEKLDGESKGVFLSLKINGKYLKEIPIFVKLFLESVNEKVLKKSSYDRMCSVCGKEKDLVISGASAFKFYTEDKPGYISGGFDSQKSWRNYPVCMDCNLYLIDGKRFIEENLKFSFYGLSYHLIPHFIFGGMDLKEEIIDILTDGEKRQNLQSQKMRDTLAGENDILDLLKDEDDHLTVHLLFLKKTNAAERILLLIQSVFPSRLREIFAAKARVEQRFRLPDGELSAYNFSRIRPFFSKSDKNSRNSDLDMYFLEITNAVFLGKPLDIRFLATFFMKEIRSEFHHLEQEDKGLRQRMKDSLMNVLFFTELGILPVEEGDIMSNSRFAPIYETYGPHLNRPEKKALFLLGCLTQMLLKVQQDIRGSQPFTKRLKGLRMLEADFKGLLPNIFEKLKEYEGEEKYKKYQRNLATLLGEEISSLLLKSDEGWKLSVDEMNFYFVTGMYLQSNVFSMLFNENEEVEPMNKNGEALE